MKKWSSSLNFNGREDLVYQIKNICERYSNIFDLVVLFGSTARGTCSDDSDIDLYIESNVLTTTRLLKSNDLDNFTLEIYGIIDMEYDLIIKGRNEISNVRKSLLYNQIDKDGVILYDKGTKDV